MAECAWTRWPNDRGIRSNHNLLNSSDLAQVVVYNCQRATASDVQGICTITAVNRVVVGACVQLGSSTVEGVIACTRIVGSKASAQRDYIFPSTGRDRGVIDEVAGDSRDS